MNRRQKKLRNKQDFLNLFNQLKPNTNYEDYNGVSCVAPVSTVEQLEKSAEYEKDLFKLCNIPYNQIYLAYFYKGYNSFAEFLALWSFGFRNLEAIDRIIEADKKYLFADQVFDYGMFAEYKDENWIRKNDNTYEELKKINIIQVCFSFKETPYLLERVRILLRCCGEPLAGDIIVQFLHHPKKIKGCINKYTRTYKKVYLFDIFIDEIFNATDDFLNEIALPKIKNEGFTKKVYLELVEILCEGLESEELLPPKTKITYSYGQENLKWKTGPYKFIVPKKAAFVYKMNNKIFDATGSFLDYDATKYEITEVCFKKGMQYKAALEIAIDVNNHFFIESIHLPKRKTNFLTDADNLIIEQWCKIKNVQYEYLPLA
jgi:hypothetical protein